ncbi:MAG: signal recognition particle protein [Gammaproteobacteria bacterium]|nr:signal recognition particle protein [Gammaproteobacteria bacterium]
MFNKLTDRMTSVLRSVGGSGRLTAENIEQAVRDVRKALLEADVALPVIKAFIAGVKERALGAEVMKSLSPGQAFIKIVNDELIAIMGSESQPLELKAQAPVVILVAGLQGAGKTTSVAKLACYLKQRQKKSVMVASCDIYRPAAIEQLAILAESIEVQFFPSSSKDNPAKIASAAIDAARKKSVDVLILDSAGRMHIDQEMMQEIRLVHQAAQPVETLFVIDSMVGQDAVNIARAFDAALPLTGVILTKVDGDARGGVALSVRYITGKPIKFLGMGEKIDALELFHPERLASRILGMGDLLSLVEEAQTKLDEKKSEQLANKLKKGRGFDLEDLREQLASMQKLGGINSIMSKLPGMANMQQAVSQQMGDDHNRKMIAIINSMTPGERRKPEVINGSRKRRIANGSGAQIQEVNRLLKQHKQMSKVMKKFSKGGMQNMLRTMQGKLPPGMGF